MSSFKSRESLRFPSQSFIIVDEGHSSFDSCSDSLFPFSPTPHQPLSQFLDHRRPFLIISKYQRRSNEPKLSTLSLYSASQHRPIPTLMGETATTKKWEWFIWAGNRPGIHVCALGRHNGDIWKGEMSREKMNIMNAYYGWVDAEICKIWYLVEWIERMAVYGEWTFPLCFVR